MNSLFKNKTIMYLAHCLDWYSHYIECVGSSQTLSIIKYFNRLKSTEKIL